MGYRVFRRHEDRVGDIGEALFMAGILMATGSSYYSGIYKATRVESE